MCSMSPYSGTRCIGPVVCGGPYQPHGESKPLGLLAVARNERHELAFQRPTGQRTPQAKLVWLSSVPLDGCPPRALHPTPTGFPASHRTGRATTSKADWHSSIPQDRRVPRSSASCRLRGYREYKGQRSWWNANPETACLAPHSRRAATTYVTAGGMPTQRLSHIKLRPPINLGASPPPA